MCVVIVDRDVVVGDGVDVHGERRRPLRREDPEVADGVRRRRGDGADRVDERDGGVVLSHEGTGLRLVDRAADGKLQARGTRPSVAHEARLPGAVQRPRPDSARLAAEGGDFVVMHRISVARGSDGEADERTEDAR